MPITAVADRSKVLIDAGVPSAFLSALDDLGSLGDLRFLLKAPESAYFYIPEIEKSYSCLLGWQITPICDGSNGDVFYVHLANSRDSKFVYFELENDEIYGDFGKNFQFMLAHLLIAFFEFSELGTEELSRIAGRLGFEKAPELLAALERDNHMRDTFESDKNWRLNNLGLIIGSGANG